MSTKEAKIVETKVDFKKNMERLRNSLENFDAAKAERIGSPSIDDVVRQGDLYLACIEKLPEGGKTEMSGTNRQLVEGTSQGSRHVLEGDCTIVTGCRYKNIDSVLCGPAFHCKSDCEVTHPEHGNKILPAGTTWHVVYQQSYAEEIRRVAD